MLEIFKFFLARTDESEKDKKSRLGYMSLFLEKFPESEFDGIDRVFYDIMQSALSIQLPVSERYIEVYSDSELRNFIGKNRIAVEATQSYMLDEPGQLEAATIVIGDVIEKEFVRLTEAPAPMEDFMLGLKEWVAVQLKSRFITAQKEAFQMLTKAKNKLIGPMEATSWLESEMGKIKEIYGEETLLAFSMEAQRPKWREVFKSSLEPVHKKLRAVYSTELLTIAAGPGVGKTSEAFGDWVYTSAVYGKQNIMCKCLEQTKEYIEGMFIARHIMELDGKVYSADDIAKERYTDKDDIARIEIARYDLFKSGKYGKIYISDMTEDFYLDTMEVTLNRINQMYGPFDGIVIDHMAIIRQDPKFRGARIPTAEIPKEAYIRLVKFLGKTRMAGIAVNQLNKEGTNQALAGKKVTPDGYAGGIEAERSSTYILIIEETEQMKIQGTKRIYSNKNRVSAPILPFMVRTWMSCAYYEVIGDGTNLAS